MNTNVKIVIGVIVGIAVIAFIANQNDSNGFTATADKAVAPITPSVELPKTDEDKEAYMGGCNEDGTMKEYCSCTYDYLKDDLGLSRSEMIRLGLDYAETNEAPEEMMSAVNACLYLL